MEPKFKDGDRVRIKDNFSELRFKGDPGITKQMLKLAGEELVVKSCILKDGHIRYLFTSDTSYEAAYWTWAEEWLELVERNKIIDLNEIEIMNMF